jgi:DNA-binding CsgD family transcriptional regulator
MIARRLGLDRGVGTVLAGNLAEALLGIGDWDRADDVLATALRDAGTFWSHHPHTLRAQLGVWRGEFDAAREHLRAGAQASLEPPSAPDHAALRAELAAWQGRVADAASAVDESLRVSESTGTLRLRLRSYALGLRVEADRARLAAAHRDARAVDEARRRARRFVDDARRLAGPAADLNPDATAWLATAEAEYAGVVGTPQPHLWAAAVAAWEQRERPYWLAYCHWQHAAALAVGGQSGTDVATEATAAARAAHRLATRLGADPVRREVELLAQRARLDLIGVRRERAGAARRAAASPLGLTAREDEVLQLLGRGYTNRQIAAELTISVKTASVHVSHILRKLGMSRRLEAATVAHRLGTPADQV